MTDEGLLNNSSNDWLTEILVGIAMAAVSEQFHVQDWRLVLGHAMGWKIGFVEGVCYALQQVQPRLDALSTHLAGLEFTMRGSKLDG